MTPKSLQLKNGDGSIGPLATYLQGPDGNVIIPTQPILPLVSRNVTSPLSGWTSCAASASAGAVTWTHRGSRRSRPRRRPSFRGVHAPFFTDVFFPVQPWSVNYFDAIGGSGVARLMVTPAQHRSDTPLASARHAFSGADFRLFYSNNLSTAALAAAPTISGISTSFDQTTHVLTFRASIVGDVRGRIHGGVGDVDDPAGGRPGGRSLAAARPRARYERSVVVDGRHDTGANGRPR